MTDVFVCSNPKCAAVHAKDPQGHCPACITSHGVGYSTMRRPVLVGTVITDEQIKHMVDRFLGWRLPENFNPDGGISFKAEYNEHTAYPGKREPTGTNLFDAEQAKVMIRYMAEGLT